MTRAWMLLAVALTPILFSLLCVMFLYLYSEVVRMLTFLLGISPDEPVWRYLRVVATVISSLAVTLATLYGIAEWLPHLTN